jgi:hypothetical protein
MLTEAFVGEVVERIEHEARARSPPPGSPKLGSPE